jgi:hypothetical protein
MSALTTKPPKKDLKLYIRCSEMETVRGFKRIAADFDNYEDVIKYLSKNYATFSKIVPPYPVHGGIL